MPVRTSCELIPLFKDSSAPTRGPGANEGRRHNANVGGAELSLLTSPSAQAFNSTADGSRDLGEVLTKSPANNLTGFDVGAQCNRDKFRIHVRR